MRRLSRNKVSQFFKSVFIAPDLAPLLALLRVGIASLLILQYVMIAPFVGEFYGTSGLIGPNLNDLLLGDPVSPRLAMLTEPLVAIGLSMTQALQLCFGVLFVALVGMLLGVRARTCAAIVLVIHTMLGATGYFATYGVDRFTHVALFYLLVFRSDQMLSVFSKGHESDQHRVRVNLGVRTLQMHFAITYFFAGFDKAQGVQWWNGDAIWYSLHIPDFAQLNVSWLAHLPLVPLVLGWATFVLEMFYPILVASHRWLRRGAVLAIISMHIGIAFALGLWLFSTVMIFLNTALFLVDPDWFKSIVVKIELKLRAMLREGTFQIPRRSQAS